MSTAISTAIILIISMAVCFYVAISICKILYRYENDYKKMSKIEIETIVEGILILLIVQLFIWSVIEDAISFFTKV